jgi:hypothetical protein
MAKKVHTKQKRMVKSPTHLKNIRGANRLRAKRPRTFKTEDAANGWAEKQGIKKFKLVDLKEASGSEIKKIKVVEL